MCMDVLYATGVPGAWNGQKKASDPLELELGVAVGAGSWAQVPCKSNWLLNSWAISLTSAKDLILLSVITFKIFSQKIL